MSVVSYTAKRSLTGGASVDDTIVLDLLLRDTLARSRMPVRSEAVAMSGSRESLYDRGEESWQGTTQVLFTQNALNMVMFLDSAEDGQVFQFAPYNSSGDSPIDYRNATLVPAPYTEAREIPTGTPVNDGFSYAFQLVEVP